MGSDLMKKQTFNTDLINLLKDKKLNVEDSLGFLLSLYYELRPSYIPGSLEATILALNIINIDYKTNTFVWNINLFEEQTDNFEWINEFRAVFKAVNPDRTGTKTDCIKRMKSFVRANPAIGKDEILKAARLYTSSLNNPVYCKKAHKFIYDTEGSVLLEYIEKLREKTNTDNEDLI